MDIHIYDTKRRKKRRFEPLDENHVTIYVCGPTVYDRVHIGNGLSAVVFDVFVRILRTVFPNVTYVRNVTDIDDKINARALELGVPIDELARECTDAMHEDFDALGVLLPDVEPKATGHIKEITTMISSLIQQGHAYEAEGHVLFYVPSDPNYGSLTNKSLKDLIDGARVEVAPYKRDPKDFVLWKPSSPELPGWKSPWGRGRPGWHIECSAMIREHLGDEIDIHGGGTDLAFPHHENEMAQSGCFNDNPDYVKYWMHNGMLNLGSQKMSKSLGNIQTVQELLHEHPGETLRYAILSGHYRQNLKWDDELIAQSDRSLTSLYQALRNAERVAGESPTSEAYAQTKIADLPDEVLAPLSDDLNTPRALAGMHELASKLNVSTDVKEAQSLRDKLLGGGWLLGLLTRSVSEFFTQDASVGEVEINRLIDERAEAKAAKQYDRADEIRAELRAKGIAIEDTREGTVWKVVKQ
ncbi:MAG: cysteine--tRNA ligase [Gammaproteobacteria bacterium]|nr:cysteine--tRNA ligase [Gammaproteobacteria bacterium]